MNSIPPPTPQQGRVIWFALTLLSAAVVCALVVGLVWGLGRILNLLSPVLWPLAIGGVLAYLLDPLVDLLVKRRIPRARAIVLVFATACVLVTGFFVSFVPQMVGEAREFAERVPAYSNKIRNRLDSWATNPPVVVQRLLATRDAFVFRTNAPVDTLDVPRTDLDPQHVGMTPAGENGATVSKPGGALSKISPEAFRSFTTWISNLLPGVGSWAADQVGRVTSWLGILIGLTLVPVYAFYFLLEKQGIQRQWTEYLPVRNSWFKEEIVFCLSSINDYLIVFFRSQVLVAICDGILYTLGFLIIGLPYAFLIGAIGTVLTMIPFIGAIVTCAAAIVVGFAATGSWQLPLLVLAVFGVVQTLEGFVISPKIMGDRVGLHPLTIIIAVLVGTQLLGGLLGGVLAIPMTAALRVIMFRYVWHQKVQNRGSSELQDS
jgi:predicted PurR-regulated permease PerM